ncbi:MAG TPA: tetratricopeptide repeat protein [Thermoanaerobaculia bacterium]|jgi:tetratricopeptide (TPR) repeat protein
MPTIDEAIALARQDEYLKALTMFADIYGTEDAPPLNTPRAAAGLSYFGLCLALVQKKFKPAIDLCRRAIELEFYNGDHYANLARVYLAAGNRKKALEHLETGMKLLPDHDYLVETRKALGVRGKPAVPFLDRSHPINVSLGQARYAKKLAEEERKKR